MTCGECGTTLAGPVQAREHASTHWGGQSDSFNPDQLQGEARRRYRHLMGEDDE